MKLFSIPADFNTDTIDRYVELNHQYNNYMVYETYGQYDSTINIPTGRLSHPIVDYNTFERYVKYSYTKGIQFNYLLNGSIIDNYELTPDGIHKIKQLILSLFNIGIKVFTVTLFPIIEIINSLNIEVELVVSTIAQVSNLELASYYIENKVKRIVLSECINRDFKTLKQLCKYTNCNYELIVNSMCFINCPFRNMHYNQISIDFGKDINEISKSYYPNRCIMRRNKCSSNYMKLAFIRPEDVSSYEAVGIKYFKIQGRQAIKHGNIYKTVETYFKESYEGNLLRLLDCFIQGNSTNNIYIDNKDLEGFINKFINSQCELNCQECKHCENYAKSSLKSSSSLLTTINQHVQKNDLFVIENEKECLK